MDIIIEINQAVSKFITKYGLQPNAIYFGRKEKKIVRDYILANFGYYESTKTNQTISGLNIIYVENESHLSLGME